MKPKILKVLSAGGVTLTILATQAGQAAAAHTYAFFK